MTRWAVVLAAAALLCSCGGDKEPSTAPNETTPSSEAPKIQLADACPRIQDALDENFDPDEFTHSGAEFQAFAADIEQLVGEVDPKGVPLLETLHAASVETAGQIDDDPFAEDVWFDAMERVTDTCQQLGAPLK